MHNPPYDVYEKYVRALCAISIVVARSSANREQNFANLKKKEEEVRSKNLASGGKQNVGWECTRRDSCADVHVGLFQHQAPLCRLPFAHAVARMARHYSCFRYARPLYAFQRLFRQTRTLDPSFVTISNFCNCRMFLVLSYNFYTIRFPYILFTTIFVFWFFYRYRIFTLAEAAGSEKFAQGSRKGYGNQIKD